MGTLRVPELVPSPAQDAERIQKAFKGWGTDEESTIWILGRRNVCQRRMIRESYQEQFKNSLIQSLQSELSGDSGKALILWTYDPAERDAIIVNETLKSKRGVKQFHVVAEVACASSPHHLIAVRQAYCSLFDCSLEEDILSKVSSPLRKLLVGIVSSYRHDKEIVDLELAKEEANKLHQCLQNKQLDHDDLMLILSTRNYFQLRATFDLYKQGYGQSIDQDVANCGKGDLKSLLQLVILCIVRPEKHFAEVIRASILGLGTDEDSLTRAIVTRAEIDMKKIKEEYLNMYGSSVEDAVIGFSSIALVSIGSWPLWNKIMV